MWHLSPALCRVPYIWTNYALFRKRDPIRILGLEKEEVVAVHAGNVDESERRMTLAFMVHRHYCFDSEVVMNKLHTLFVSLLLGPLLFITAQAQIRIAPVTSIGETVTCHVGGSRFTYRPDHSQLSARSWTGKTAETQAIFDKVSGFTDLRSTVYTLPVTNTNVNVEICPGDKNYIVYNSDWIRSLYNETKNRWVLYAVMAHEIGHYVRGHQHTRVGSNPDIEIEADEYAGEVLAKMGASLDDAQAAFRSDKMRSETATHTHPPVNERLLAVESGWRRVTKRNVASHRTLRRESKTTSIGRTGYIQGLNGRLNPILDSQNRTYLYADNIAIEGGKNQPVTFSLNQPFVVEDSFGNQFEFKISSIGKNGATIEHIQLSSAANREQATLNLRVVDQDSRPVRGAEVYAIFSDGTHVQGTTDSSGAAQIQRLKDPIVTVYCAHPRYKAFYKERHDVGSRLVVDLEEQPKTGSIIIESTGHIPGLDGRLNPKLDSNNRMYLYADNISIENGRKQPASFTLNQPFQVEDAAGDRFELRVIAIIAASTLIEFTRLN